MATADGGHRAIGHGHGHGLIPEGGGQPVGEPPDDLEGRLLKIGVEQSVLAGRLLPLDRLTFEATLQPLGW